MSGRLSKGRGEHCRGAPGDRRGNGQVGVVGLGRLTLSRRERMVVVEPRGTGMALFTLHAAGEVRAPRGRLSVVRACRR
jgi:non-homologous end joining protein Ku